MKKVLNLTLCLCFAVTCLVPVTGIALHKLAAASFLLLTIFHIVLYRRKLSKKRWLLAAGCSPSCFFCQRTARHDF